jgi:preprotein translocase subunit SecD
MVTAVHPDGIYLVAAHGDDDVVALPVLNQGYGEWVRSTPLMSLQVASVAAELDPRRNAPVIQLQLVEGLAATFASVSERNIGNRLAFVVGGMVIVGAHIIEAILQGRLSIAVGGDIASATRQAECLRSARLVQH